MTTSAETPPSAVVRSVVRSLKEHGRTIVGGAHQLDLLTADLDAQERLMAEMIAALDFYACVDHYQTHNAVSPNEVQIDKGGRARALLARGT